MTATNHPDDHVPLPGDQADGSAGDSGKAAELKDAASEQAKQVAGTAKDEAGAVVDTAKEQAQAVAADVRAQTKQLADEARGQLSDHAVSQRDRAVENLNSLSEEFSAMAESSEGSGLAVQLAKEGGELAQQGADFLADRDPGQLLDEVRDLARRRPGAFLLGAAVAGLVVGRATRGVVSAHQSDEGLADQASTTTTDLLPGHSSPRLEGDLWGPAAPGYPSDASGISADQEPLP